MLRSAGNCVVLVASLASFILLLVTGGVCLIERVEKVRSKMEEKGLTALLITHPPNIFYVSGFSGSSARLLVTQKRFVLYTDFRYMEQAAAEAPFCEIVKLAGAAGPSLFQKITELLKSDSVSAIAVEEASLTLQEFNRLKAVANGLEVFPCSGVVEEIRAVKEKSETESIIAAVRIADDALRETLPLLQPGISEREFAAELEYRMRLAGAAGMAFSTIVASGPRSALPHGIAANRIIGEGELIVVDFGAVWDNYCSDMTRTFVLGEPTPEQESIHALVCAGREVALQTIKVGAKATAVDAAVRQLFDKEGYGAAFGHGLGHGVGVEVHERPTLSPLSKDELQENMVFSVEPGIYLEGHGGVRVEDLVVLRPEGPQVITGSRREIKI